MKKLFKYWGYSNDLDYKDKVVYPFTLLNISVGLLYLVLYLVMVPFIPAIIVQSIFVGINCLNLLSLRNKHYKFAKLILTYSFIIQLTLAVFLWFPVETGFAFYYLLVPVAAFFIYHYDNKVERGFSIGLSVVVSFLYLYSQLMPMEDYLFPLESPIMSLFNGISIVTTLFPLIFVFVIYSREQGIMQKELKILANTDGLTRILNRRALYVQGVEEFALSTKYHYEFTLILIDLDHFKRVNDQYGHPIGDELLIELTEVITHSIRKFDIFSRYGGEEFALILRRTTKEDGIQIANHLLEKISKHSFTFSNGHKMQITVSMGLVQFNLERANFDEMIKLVDRALYESKEKGRNQLTVY